VSNPPPLVLCSFRTWRSCTRTSTAWRRCPTCESTSSGQCLPACSRLAAQNHFFPHANLNTRQLQGVCIHNGCGLRGRGGVCERGAVGQMGGEIRHPPPTHPLIQQPVCNHATAGLILFPKKGNKAKGLQSV